MYYLHSKFFTVNSHSKKSENATIEKKYENISFLEKEWRSFIFF